MRDSLLLLTAAASLLLTACGSTRPEVRSAPPAAAPLPSPPPVIAEYHPGPAPAVEVSSSAVVMLSTGPMIATPSPESAPAGSAVAASTATTPVVSALPAVNVVPRESPAALSSDANIVVLVSEAVGGPEEDLGSYTKVFVDNQLQGQTQKAAKSAEKRWGASLSPGNHLFRFEKWDLPMVGDWTMLDSQWQPAERFIRLDADSRAVVHLKFYDEGHGFNLQIDRGPLTDPLP